MTDVTPRTASVPGVDSFRRVTFAHTGARTAGSPIQRGQLNLTYGPDHQEAEAAASSFV